MNTSESKPADVLAVIDEMLAGYDDPKIPRPSRKRAEEARAAVAELIAERNRLTNTVRSHEAQIIRMTDERAQAIEAAQFVVKYADSEPDGGDIVAMHRANVERCRAFVARVQGGSLFYSATN